MEAQTKAPTTVVDSKDEKGKKQAKFNVKAPTNKPKKNTTAATKKGSARITYVKFKVTFRCSKAECSKKDWTSAHGWREDEVYCEFCESPAIIMNVLDENLKLDNFRCPDEKCGEYWQAIHDETIDQQECFACGTLVTRDAEDSQTRFGRHFWFKCAGPKCAVEWEDFSLTPQRTQRCTKCHSRGDIIAIQKLIKPVRREEEGEVYDGPIGGRRGGMHIAEYCDMCMDLRRQGVRKSCLYIRKVKCEIVEENGAYAEKIVEAR